MNITPRVCRIIAFGLFLGVWCYYFAYFWGLGQEDFSDGLLFLSQVAEVVSVVGTTNLISSHKTSRAPGLGSSVCGICVGGST